MNAVETLFFAIGGNNTLLNRLTAMLTQVPANLAPGTAMAVLGQIATSADEVGKEIGHTFTAMELIYTAKMVADLVALNMRREAYSQGVGSGAPHPDVVPVGPTIGDEPPYTVDTTPQPVTVSQAAPLCMVGVPQVSIADGASRSFATRHVDGDR